ncbi:MAG: TIGR00268 family protein, partial [Myxococcales bacterium]|nr:TIGR00268 family protein [Myxococcales bacterium]
LTHEAYRRNDGQRCFHCKDALFDVLHRTRAELGLAQLLYGYQRDDTGEHRPGQRAAEQHAVATPLADAGLGKSEIRALSRQLGIPNVDRPAQPCLASRLHYGTVVDRGYLLLVERVEAFLRERGIIESRARFDGATLRIEVPLVALPAVACADWREELVALARREGATFVALDLEGFASGKTNRLLEVLE